MDNIHVIGSARSGTTWLAEILASSGLELNFEPESTYYKNVEVHDMNFPSNLYLSEYTRGSKWSGLVRKMASGHIQNSWTSKCKLYTSSCKVIKYIRVSFLLPWLLENVSGFYIWIRSDPFSTISSMKRTGWFDGDEYESVISQERLVDKHFRKYESIWNMRNLDWIEGRSLQWCLEYTFMSKYMSKLITVSYEDLVRNTDDVIKKLSKRIPLNYKDINKKHMKLNLILL